MGATAILSRSSFPCAGAGDVTVCAHGSVATQTMAPSVPRRNARRRDFCIVLSSLCLLRTRYERDCWSDCNPWHTDSGHRYSLTAGIWRMQLLVRRSAESPAAPAYDLLHTRLLLLARGDQPGVADVAAVPAGEGPVVDDLGVHDHLDAHIEEGHDLKILELIVADLAQLRVPGHWVSDLHELLPHL